METREKLALLPERLLCWYGAHHRILPWRQDREPYHVWVSEIMLQQTRVEAVREKYLRFLRALPTVEALAACDTDFLMKLWEGLGYYSRARNLQKAAQVIQREYGGRFPQTYEAVRALPGIGDYTAGAICSICFDAPTPAVDGNVLRVYSRLTALEAIPTAPEEKREITDALREIYPVGQCGTFTQALMELGATVCVPNGEPLCCECPLREICLSGDGLWKRYPLKKEKKPRRQEEKTVLLLRCGEKVALEKRPEGGLLGGLWQFPHTEGILDENGAWQAAESCRPVRLLESLRRTHIFTHIEWDMVAYRIDCEKPGGGYTWVDIDTVEREISLPTAFRMFWESVKKG